MRLEIDGYTRLLNSDLALNGVGGEAVRGRGEQLKKKVEQRKLKLNIGTWKLEIGKIKMETPKRTLTKTLGRSAATWREIRQWGGAGERTFEEKKIAEWYLEY